MSTALLFGLCGIVLFVLGLYFALTTTEMLRRILAINIMGNGVFMLLIAAAYQHDVSGLPNTDPVPHALVLTGIVVAVSATALALKLVCRAHELAAEQREEGDG
ncbi:multisubunit sodium/proton antiporter, MrpC subunit [Modicisalibacter ilicicola DSM 19980]|uniref:Multisubunit sodium/proton antiporter, MrpC subunit n=1 Tax=Modicisalibacter ilicicola DSM 19980 TaxID=1121942 RepID=A0A1M4ZQ41_9GAMM|nr:cation:proton antiporter subunit C [Halomonas ilicicola]SHF20220.1 multisubunit sodium/proton antiporter, MrpC subunit [Halomonas ilicicola DSM 19980]